MTRERVLALCLLLVVAACQRQKLEIPEAAVSVDDLPEPADTQPNSYVSAPIVFDYRPLIEQLEERIPRVIGSVDKEQRKQQRMREKIRDVSFCLMVATTLHSIAVGNLLPAWVRVVCVDINPSVVTKLVDRGSAQTMGVVTDTGLFVHQLARSLR